MYAQNVAGVGNVRPVTRISGSEWGESPNDQQGEAYEGGVRPPGRLYCVRAGGEPVK